MFIRHCPSKDPNLQVQTATSGQHMKYSTFDYQSDLSFKATNTMHCSRREKVSVNKIDFNTVPMPTPTVCEQQQKSTD